MAVRADLTKAEDRQRLVAETTVQLGPPDILVNNAALIYSTPVADFTARRFALMLNLQLEAPFQLVQLVVPGMREAGAGS